MSEEENAGGSVDTDAMLGNTQGGGQEKVVDPAILKQMEEAAVAGLGTKTIPDEPAPDGLEDLAQKYGEGSEGDLDEDPGLQDPSLSQVPDDLDDDLDPLPNEDGDSDNDFEGGAGDEEGEEPEVSKLRHDPEPEIEPFINEFIATDEKPGIITLKFYPKRTEIDASRITGLSNAHIQRGLQRVFRKLHEIRNLERQKQTVARLQHAIEQTGQTPDLLEKLDAAKITVRNIEARMNSKK